MNPDSENSPSRIEGSPPRVRDSQSTAIGTKPSQSDAIRVGTFWLNGDKKHYAIVNGPDIHSQDCLNDIREYWGLSSPGYLLQTNASSTHRDGIISEENAPIILKEILNNDSVQTTQKGKGEGTTASSDRPVEADIEVGNLVEEELDWMREYTGEGKVVEKDWMWINRYLQRKIIHSLSSIVSACDITNCWILCHGAPGTNEKMLEAAMEMTGASPTILVVDGLDQYSHATDEKLSQLVTNARPMHSEENPDKLDFDDMKDTYDVVNKRTSIIDNSFEPGSSLWKHNTAQTWKADFPWSHGTHFIFSDNFKDFNPRLLGPNGFLCMHGSIAKDEGDRKRTGFIIRDCIMTVKPCLLFDNSGAETQAYARLIRRIKERDREVRQNFEQGKRKEEAKAIRKRPLISLGNAKQPGRSLLKKAASKSNPDWYETEKKKPDYLHELKLTLRCEAWKLIEYANMGYGLKPRNAVNLEDVMQIVDMYCSNPRLFRKIVVPIDPLNDSPDEIVKVLTLSFARASTEAREVGAGNADKNCVEEAWRLHEQLERSKIIKNFQKNLLYFLYILAGFLTVLIAVLNRVVEEVEHSGTITRWVTVSLAAIVSLCGGILSLISADAQVNTICNAQAKIIDEIFRFRMRVGKYSLSAHERALESDADGASSSTTSKAKRGPPGDQPKSQSQCSRLNASAAMHGSRDLFSKTVLSIVQDISSLDLYPSKRFLSGKIDDSLDREFFEAYAREQLHLPPWLERKSFIALSGMMTPEEYFEIRVQSMLIMLEDEEKKVRNITRTFQVASMLLSSTAVVLGSADYIEPIPVVIAGATGIHQLLKVGDYERRFEIVSSAARELRGLEGHWASLSDLDHQQRASIVNLVSTCEQLMFQYATKSAIQVDRAQLGMKPSNFEDSAK